MNVAKIIEILNVLLEKSQTEILDPLKYQDAKERILASDVNGGVTFDNVDDLMGAIDNAD